MRNGSSTLDHWLRPRTIDEASRLAGEDGAILIAGGCELVGRLGRTAGQFSTLVDLQKVTEFEPLYAHPKKGLRIGALTTIRQASNNLWLAKRWAALHEAAEQFSSPQASNTATVVGNICAGDPRYDMATALLAHRANVQLYRNSGISAVGLSEFYRGLARPDLRHGNIVTGISAPPPEPDAGSAFRRIQLMQRRPSDMTSLAAAACVALDPAGKTIREAAVAVRACTRGPLRAIAVEIELIGMPAVTETFERAGQIAADSRPVPSNLDPAEHYKQRLVLSLVRDVIEQAVSRARSKHNPFEDATDLLRQ